jgi:hypothetical protein
MNKRGASHTDWAISMAIFIVYILLMIIFLKPGVAAIYKPEGLMQLVETNFFDETNWVVRETWLDIDTCKGYLPGGSGTNYKDCTIHIEDTSGNWEFKNVDKENDFDPKLLNNDEQYFSFATALVTCKKKDKGLYQLRIRK